jgi:hypothetical protein
LDVHRLNKSFGGRWKGSGQEIQSKASSKPFSAMRESATAFITELLAMTDIPDDALVDKVGAIGRFATCCPTRRPGCIALSIASTTRPT